LARFAIKLLYFKGFGKCRKGDLENGLVFAGTNVGKIKEIVSVKELINELVSEANAILEKQPLIVNK
jgi:NAD(P)H-dependent flavin oxidoreductase YrpB (nitropropane dioxygenase family)